jgi:guanosine-3',5'-bis(diphosphate) 3'-pyrophosphohydrolase
MKEQIRKVHKAMNFAIEKHGEQKRKYTNAPYWNHLAEVAGLCSAFYDDYISISVAWLHDVLEDTQTTEDELISEFGPHIAYGVRMLSDTEAGNRTERKRIARERLSKCPSWVQNIKLCDIISNTSSIVEYDKKFARIYLEEVDALVRCLDLADENLKILAFKIINDGIDEIKNNGLNQKYYEKI